MIDSTCNISDHGYTIMAEILENKNVTQRDFLKKLEVSVNTVNVLINKIITMPTSFGLVEEEKKIIKYLER